jgi:DNA-binding NtrC family response regulator
MERPKVLVIEDDPDSRDLLSELLSEDFDTETAADGERGLARFRARAADVVVTDETLPGIRGTQLAREVKAISPETRVVLVSGYTDVEGAEACDLVLKKPIDADRLTEALHALTGGRP